MRFITGISFVTCIAVALIGCGGSWTYKEVYGTVRIDLGGLLACKEGLPSGYSDVPSMQIIVRDVDEKFLTEMEPNPFNRSSDSCMLGTWSNLFSGEDLPKRDKYIIDSGRRGQIFVDAEEFETSDDGEVKIFNLTLGD